MKDLSKLLPEEIYERSFQIIKDGLGDVGWSDAEYLIVQRMVHTVGDLAFAELARIHPDAVARGIAALNSGKQVICDSRMLEAGMTRLRGRVLCAIDDPAIAEKAKAEGMTRSAAAMESFADKLPGSIVAIGNAPTALWKILELVKNGVEAPALVVGLPVGFVGAAESKDALMASELCYISNAGTRGGSPLAASAINALCIMANEENDS